MAKGYAGNPSYTEAEVEDFLKENGPRMTSEVADEYNVTGEAVRQRLEKMRNIESRKVRNRKVWYVPHEQPETEATTDGHGHTWGGIPTAGYAPLASRFGYGFAGLAVVLAFLNILYSVPLAYALVSVVVSLLFLHVTREYQDKADPAFEMKDAVNSVEGGKE